ncbi:MAG: hypothetical protein QOJ86_1696 [Bradyrhizobium sp.]|nr:hypothetical protein [Bradyrhizobium sp.]
MGAGARDTRNVSRHQPSASRGQAPNKLDTSNQSVQIEMRLSVAVRSPKIDLSC